MSIQSMDFQSIIHQQINRLIEEWRMKGLTEDEIQESASQFFNLGQVAAEQLIQEGGVQAQGTEYRITYTPENSTNIVVWFLSGMSNGLLKAQEEKLPSSIKWELLQKAAYHVFDHSKQAVVATFGQEQTPDVQISDEQIIEWLSQTATEALLYYLAEYERQFGPINRVFETTPSLLTEASETAEEEEEGETPSPAEAPTPAATAAPVPAPSPLANIDLEVQHRYAAVGLLLGGLSTAKQGKILAPFSPQEQQLIQFFRDPEMIAKHLDLGKVAKYLKRFKEKMGYDKGNENNPYNASLAVILPKLPQQRLQQLFERERPLLRSYIHQHAQASSQFTAADTMPSGVKECIILYLGRNFPKEMGAK